MGDEVAHFAVIQEKYIQPLLSYIRGQGNLPKPPPNQYVELYTKVQKILDSGNELCASVLRLYEKVLGDFV